jgi:hypothetical protein
MYVPKLQSLPHICDERVHQSEVRAFNADQDIDTVLRDSSQIASVAGSHE